MQWQYELLWLQGQSLWSSTDIYKHVYVDYIVRTSTVQQSTVGYHDWKIDTGKVFLRGFRRNGHLAFPVRNARLNSLILGGGGGDKMPTATKKWQLAWQCAESLFVICLPFLWETLASPSCLSVRDYATAPRSHPITLLRHFLSTVCASRASFK